MAQGQTVLVKYAKTSNVASEKIRDTSGNNNELTSISTGQTVTNNVPDTTAPTVSSITTTAAVADSVLTITGITSNGIYTVTGTISGNYAVNDLVTISSCGTSSSGNNDVFKISDISSQDITLVNKDTGAALTGQGTVVTDCKISKLNSVIVTFNET